MTYIRDFVVYIIIIHGFRCTWMLRILGSNPNHNEVRQSANRKHSCCNYCLQIWQKSSDNFEEPPCLVVSHGTTDRHVARLSPPRSVHPYRERVFLHSFIMLQSMSCNLDMPVVRVLSGYWMYHKSYPAPSTLQKEKIVRMLWDHAVMSIIFSAELLWTLCENSMPTPSHFSW